MKAANCNFVFCWDLRFFSRIRNFVFFKTTTDRSELSRNPKSVHFLSSKSSADSH